MTTKIISIYNNKGGVGKTNLAWNISDSLAALGKRVLLIDFDPQCNLSIAVLGEDNFVHQLPTQNTPYGTTIRAYLQRFVQNTGGEEIYTHTGPNTDPKVELVAGDFWLNVFADSLNVGADLLAGTGIARYVVLRRIIEAASKKVGYLYDYALIDLPPSFGSLVRAALYSSDYFLVPCTSDNFSAYCVGLIGQMLPRFLGDWDTGMTRFKESNPHYSDYDTLGRPKFAGWVFNGFDMRAGDMVRADATHHERITRAIKDDLVAKLQPPQYNAVAPNLPVDFKIGEIEDMNVLVQNSLWQNVPVSKLDQFRQLRDLQNRGSWAQNQIQQIQNLRGKFSQLAQNVIAICV